MEKDEKWKGEKDEREERGKVLPLTPLILSNL